MAEKSIVNPCWTRAATGLIQRREGEGEGKRVRWKKRGGDDKREGEMEGEGKERGRIERVEQAKEG